MNERFEYRPDLLPGPVYLAGPMTGRPNHNFPLFHSVAAWLRVLGYEVVNPAELDEADRIRNGMPWDYYLRRDIRALLFCRSIIMLPGYMTSKGARLELHIARELGMPQGVVLSEPARRFTLALLS